MIENTSYAPVEEAGSTADIYNDTQDVSKPLFKVLFLDDETSIVSSLYRLFRREGYELYRAHSGAEALEMLDSNPVDLVISDMRMPEMNGADFFSRLVESHPDTVRILLTGYSDMDATIHAINEGKIHRYCTKPWNDEDLKLVVSQALETKHLQAEKRRLSALAEEQHREIQALVNTLEDKVKARTAELERKTIELREGFTASIKVFTNLTELREHGNPGHNRRVAKLARRLAEGMGLGEQECEAVYFGSLLHDIGKIGLPDRLIKEPEYKMGKQDRALFQKHSEIGYASLIAFEPLHEAAEIIHAHHERYDGKGYPLMMAGDEIPLGARILAVADEFDSLLIGGELRNPMTSAEAQDFIAHQSGKRFDPEVISALYELMIVRPTGDLDGAVTKLKLHDLREGMVLAEDLINDDGVMLLPEKFQLTTLLIERLKSMAAPQKANIIVSIETSSIVLPNLDLQSKGQDDSLDSDAAKESRTDH